MTCASSAQDDKKPVELRAFLRNGDTTLTETWSYILPGRTERGAGGRRRAAAATSRRLPLPGERRALLFADALGARRDRRASARPRACGARGARGHRGQRRPMRRSARACDSPSAPAAAPAAGHARRAGPRAAGDDAAARAQPDGAARWRGRCCAGRALVERRPTRPRAMAGEIRRPANARDAGAAGSCMAAAARIVLLR